MESKDLAVAEEEVALRRETNDSAVYRCGQRVDRLTADSQGCGTPARVAVGRRPDPARTRRKGPAGNHGQRSDGIRRRSHAELRAIERAAPGRSSIVAEDDAPKRSDEHTAGSAELDAERSPSGSRRIELLPRPSVVATPPQGAVHSVHDPGVKRIEREARHGADLEDGAERRSRVLAQPRPLASRDQKPARRVGIDGDHPGVLQLASSQDVPGLSVVGSCKQPVGRRGDESIGLDGVGDDFIDVRGTAARKFQRLPALPGIVASEDAQDCERGVDDLYEKAFPPSSVDPHDPHGSFGQPYGDSPPRLGIAVESKSPRLGPGIGDGIGRLCGADLDVAAP